MLKIKRLEIVFLLAGLLLFTLCFFMNENTIDINVHDTYFVIAYFHIGILFLLIHCFFALIYFLMRKHRTVLLGILHLLLGTPFFIYIILLSYFFAGGSVRRYYTHSVPENIFDTTLPNSFYFVITLFIIGQLIFLANIFISIFKAIKPLI
jgi:heme/copper-type cytochrome/quinol oxidase subunit 1